MQTNTIHASASTASQIHPRLPPELWGKIASYLTLVIHRKSLHSLSLVSSFLRDIAQAILLSSVRFDISGLAKQLNKANGSPINSTTRTAQHDHETDAAKELERLQFYRSPRIAPFVKYCTITHNTFGNHPMIKHMDYRSSYTIIDQIFSALTRFSALEYLYLGFFPIPSQHLPILNHSAFSRARIVFYSSSILKDQALSGLKSMTLSSVEIACKTDNPYLLDAILTPSLKSLRLTLNAPWFYTNAFKKRRDLSALTSLDIDERGFADLMPHFHLFSNISSLVLSTDIGETSKKGGDWVPSSVFPSLEHLECPIHLLPQFVHCSIRRLVLTPSDGYLGFSDNESTDLDLDSKPDTTAVLQQSNLLLSRLTFLKLKRIPIDRGELEKLIELCPALEQLIAVVTLEFGPDEKSSMFEFYTRGLRDNMLAETKTENLLNRLAKLNWPVCIEKLELMIFGEVVQWKDDLGLLTTGKRLYAGLLSSFDMPHFPNFRWAVFGAMTGRETAVAREYVYAICEGEDGGEWKVDKTVYWNPNRNW